MKPKIIIIETSDVGAAYTAEAIIKLNYEPIFICTMNNYQSDTYDQIIKYPYYDCNDTTQINNIIKIIDDNKIEKIEGVITMLDSRLSISIELAEFLDVPGIDPAIKTLFDKGKVIKLIPEHSPKTIQFNIDNIPFNELSNVLSNCTKLIFKPTCSAGAFGMFIIDSNEKLKDIQNIIKRFGIEKLLKGEWVAQPFLPGRLVSIEGYVFNGKANFVGFSARQKLDNTESVNYFPANDFIGEKSVYRVYQIINELIIRSKYKNGYFHSEFIINNDDCNLIDANFGRIGGGGVAQQIAVSYQKNPIDIYTHLIELTLFNRVSNNNIYQNVPVRSLSVHYGLQEDATLSSLSLPINTGVLHTQLLGNGTLVPKMGINNWSWLGIAVGYPNELVMFLNSLVVTTNNGVKKPYYLKGGVGELEKISGHKENADISEMKEGINDKSLTM